MLETLDARFLEYLHARALQKHFGSIASRLDVVHRSTSVAAWKEYGKVARRAFSDLRWIGNGSRHG